MSVFFDVIRYANRDPDTGERLPITLEHLQAVAAARTRFRIVQEDGAVGIKVLSTAVAVLEDGGTLSCRLDPNMEGDEIDLLEETLREIAALIPDAVLEDEG